MELRLAWQRPSLCAELELHLLAPDVDLDVDAGALAAAPPWWAFCWASGQALARFVLDRPELVRGRCVLDLGAGSGVVALAAARAGATRVLACDPDPAARAAVVRAAARAGLALEVVADAGTAAGIDLLLAADVCYEPAVRSRLLAAADAGRAVLIADPERRGPPLPECRLERLARLAARTLPDVDETTPGASIYRVLPEPRVAQARRSAEEDSTLRATLDASS